MNKKEAIEFLQIYQPMPDDENLSQDLVDKYDEVRRFFIINPDNEVIHLFLNSYGQGDGWGVYQLVEDVFYQNNHEDVVLCIKKTLEDKLIPESVRYWVTQVSALFADVRLIKGLEMSLKSENEDIRNAAQLSLDIING